MKKSIFTLLLVLQTGIRARLNLEIRKIRLAQTITEYETKQGITWN